MSVGVVPPRQCGYGYREEFTDLPETEDDFVSFHSSFFKVV